MRRATLIGISGLVAGLVALPGAAGAAGLSLSYNLGAAGRGLLIARSPAPLTYSWRRCDRRGEDCVTVRGAGPGRQVLDVGGAATGSRFRVTARGGSLSALSRPYLGRVRPGQPPRTRGPVRVGSFVTPLPGRWRGGWGNERDALQLQVCRAAHGGRCVVVYDTDYLGGSGRPGARLAPKYAGWYLRVVDQREGRDTPVASIAYAPGAVPARRPGPTVSEAVAARIQPRA